MVTVKQEATRPKELEPARTIGGVGGLVFVASVVAQNLIRAASMPANDARAGRIIDFYTRHRGSTFVLAALFAVGAAGLAAFAGSLVARLSAAHVRGAALAGVIGVAGVFAVYSTMLAIDLALSGYVHRGSPGPDVVSAMWILHNAVFGILLVAIGVALAGLSAAAAADGVVGGLWKQVGLLGALLLGIAGAATPAIIDGSPVMVLGLIGFLTWLAFVVTTAISMLRNARRRRDEACGTAMQRVFASSRPRRRSCRLWSSRPRNAGRQLFRPLRLIPRDVPTVARAVSMLPSVGTGRRN